MRRVFQQIVPATRRITLNRLMLIGMASAGLAAILLSSQQSWFEVPLASQNGILVSHSVEISQPGVVGMYRAAAIVLPLLLTVSWWWRRQWTGWSVTIACVWLLLVFAFPCLVMVHDPSIASQATWLQMQHDNLIWLGGDINTSQEFSRFGWKSRVYIVDAPRQLSVIRLPNWSPLEIGFDRVSQLVEWLGYTNAFCQFVAKGWYFACLGGVAILLSTCFQGEQLDSRRIGFAVSLLVCLISIYCLIAWSIPFRASRHLAIAAEHTSRGEYDAASEVLTRAESTLPLLREDTYYVAQRGLLDFQLGRNTPHASIHRANLLERDSLYYQALTEYQKVIEKSRAGSAIRREAVRALLRFAVHSLNSGDDEQAIDQLRQTLALEPHNLKAGYMLQIAYLRSGQHAELYAMVDHLYSLCRHFRFPTKKVILATAQQHAMYAAMLEGDAVQAWERSIKMKRP